jgi:hypothetical protein
MIEGLRKKVGLYSVEEYNLDSDEREELKLFLARILGRKVTGEVIVNLAQGGVNALKLCEPLKLTK